MPVHTFHVVAWRTGESLHTAVALHDAGMIARAGNSGAAALRRLRKELLRRGRSGGESDLEPRELTNPALSTIRVDVHGEYDSTTQGGPSYSTEVPVALHLPCLRGRVGAGVWFAALPTFGIAFLYRKASELKPLVIRHVTSAVAGETPSELVRRLPVQEARLEKLSVRISGSRRWRMDVGERFETLSQVADPMAANATLRRFVHPWEREGQLQSLRERLDRDRANVLIVGESGAGKTTLVVAAARALERDAGEAGGGRVHRFWMTGAGRIAAGMRYLGEWQERVESLIAELDSVGGVLCLESLLEAIVVGGTGPESGIAAFLMPYLQQGDLRMVVEVTPDELDACRRLLPGLLASFQIVLVPPLGDVQARNVLQRVAASRAERSGIEFEQELVSQVHRLFSRFAPYGAFPGRASQFVLGLFERAVREKRELVSVSDAIAAFGARTGLPDLLMRDEEVLDVSALREHFRSLVLGQDAACEAMVSLVCTLKAGLNDTGRPIAVLLFCGPTGVGKTALARSLADYLFGRDADAASRADERFLRIDMSEFGGPGAAERLLGTVEEPGAIVERLRQQPFQVVLLDEIEKAHPEVFDVLMGTFDEGRITDKLGRTTSARSAVIIMTSNLGAGSGHSLGFGEDAPPDYRSEVMRFFRPEFFNRMDAVVEFGALDAATVRAVTEKELRDLVTREGLEDRALELRWTPEVVDRLAAVGFDARYGARPLQRAIERDVVAPLAELLVRRPELGLAVVRLEVRDDRIAVEVSEDE